MNDSKHSPGDWRPVDMPGGEFTVMCLGPDGREYAVAEVFQLGVEPENRIPNARLIAAAPNLLAACESALPNLDYECVPNEVYFAVRDAIAKAKSFVTQEQSVKISYELDEDEIKCAIANWLNEKTSADPELDADDVELHAGANAGANKTTVIALVRQEVDV